MPKTKKYQEKSLGASFLCKLFGLDLQRLQKIV